MFAPNSPPSTPIPAARVVLVRQTQEGAEVLLVRRHRGASFMSDSFVFPGGKIDSDDGTPEHAAVRELFEETGVLLAHPTPEGLAAHREELVSGRIHFGALMARERISLHGDLRLWGRWITPSVEPKRFDALFFVAVAPTDQAASPNASETVEELWTTPTRALARHEANELKLPPPQLCILTELAPHQASVEAILTAATSRPSDPPPIMPRLAQLADRIMLLLPWDPDYAALGQGDSHYDAAQSVIAGGASRVVFNGARWHLASKAGV